MINTPITEFTIDMARLWAAYGRGTVEDVIVASWYQDLIKYSVADVRRAFDYYRLTGSHGAFPPGVPQIIAQIPGAEMRVDLTYLRSQLVKPTTTVGALACAAVGSHDRKMMGDQSADRSITAVLNSFINDLPEMTKEITEGRGYLKSQISTLKSGRYPGIDHTEFNGAKIQPATMLENKARAQVMRNDGTLMIEAQPTEPTDKKAAMHPSIAKQLAEITAGLEKPEYKPRVDRKPTTCKNQECGTLIGGTYDACPRCNQEVMR